MKRKRTKQNKQIKKQDKKYSGDICIRFKCYFNFEESVTFDATA